MLTLGIGAGTATFGVVHGVLLRPLPNRDAGAIVFVGEARGMPSRSPVFLTNATLPQIRTAAQSFEELAAYREGLFDWASPGAVPPEFDMRLGHRVVAGRAVPLEPLLVGSYRLEIRVTDNPSGAVATRDVAFTVQPVP